ncbi:MAG TPA: alpha/beta hydrolase [Stellaceae bacterium]|jgi:pimeloyl-ACP methyl ester carboxylesterase|nr:alpha/beta hydrolase [Stellaceae bacterium]
MDPIATPSGELVNKPPILARADGATIAYHRLDGKSPGIVFLGGFRSDMTGSKAMALEAFCRARGQAFLRFDYFAHGASSGEFAEATIGRWRDDVLAVLDALTAGPQILVGSSIGGWLMLLTALARPARIAALVGIAAAPDATEDLMWRRLSPAQQQAMRQGGSLTVPSEYDPAGYLLTHRLIEEGRAHLLLRGPVALSCPVRLLHGMADRDVPWPTSLRLAERLASADVTLTLIKDGDHRLSGEADLARLRSILTALM